MMNPVTIQIPRLHADALASLIIKTPRERLPTFLDYEHLMEFVEGVEAAKRLENAIYNCGLRQFGMQSLRNDRVETFEVSPAVALSLAYFMEEHKRAML